MSASTSMTDCKESEIKTTACLQKNSREIHMVSYWGEDRWKKENKTNTKKHKNNKKKSKNKPKKPANNNTFSFHISFPIYTCNKMDQLPRRWSLVQKPGYNAQGTKECESGNFLQFYITPPTADPYCRKSLNEKSFGTFLGKKDTCPSFLKFFFFFLIFYLTFFSPSRTHQETTYQNLVLLTPS